MNNTTMPLHQKTSKGTRSMDCQNRYVSDVNCKITVASQ
jgi:hypothetical protein